MNKEKPFDFKKAKRLTPAQLQKHRKTIQEKIGKKIESENGYDLLDFFVNETRNAIKHKFVKESPKDHGWAGSWVVDGEKCFLVKIIPELRLNSKKELIPSLEKFSVICEGNDDLAMYLREQTRLQAIEIFDKITDFSSREELTFFFGINHE